MTAEPADEVLLEAVRNGDDAALSALLARHAPAVLRFGMRMCREPEDARDVLQETLVAAARGLREFRGGASLSTWLYAIARSFCVKQRRQSKFASSTVPLDAGTGGDAVRDVIDAEPTPDRQLERRELGAALEDAIRSLEPSYREVLVLRDVEGLSAAEVSDVLGLGVDAVKSRLHRARVAVREQLEPWLATGEAPRTAASGCADIAQTFSRYLEGEIGPAECTAMQKHLATCPRCEAACDALKRVLTACRASATEELPAEVREEVRNAIRTAVSRAPEPRSSR